MYNVGRTQRIVSVRRAFMPLITLIASTGAVDVQASSLHWRASVDWYAIWSPSAYLEALGNASGRAEVGSNTRDSSCSREPNGQKAAG